MPGNCMILKEFQPYGREGYWGWILLMKLECFFSFHVAVYFKYAMFLCFSQLGIPPVGSYSPVPPPLIPKVLFFPVMFIEDVFLTTLNLFCKMSGKIRIHQFPLRYDQFLLDYFFF